MTNTFVEKEIAAFVKRFFVYDMEKNKPHGDHVGAEKTAAEYLRTALEAAVEHTEQYMELARCPHELPPMCKDCVNAAKEEGIEIGLAKGKIAFEAAKEKGKEEGRREERKLIFNTELIALSTLHTLEASLEKMRLPEKRGHYGPHDHLHIQHNIGFNACLDSVLQEIRQLLP